MGDGKWDLNVLGNGKWFLKPAGNTKCVCSTGFKEMGLIRNPISHFISRSISRYYGTGIGTYLDLGARETGK
jgi:hypothetical protein